MLLGITEFTYLMLFIVKVLLYFCRHYVCFINFIYNLFVTATKRFAKYKEQLSVVPSVY